jgi:hypothetical protein
MNNIDISLQLDSCKSELDNIKLIIDSLGPASNIVPYLNKYAVVKACGVIEVAYKNIIADYCDKRSKPQVKTFLKKHVRDNSKNPNYGNISRLLKDFDENWYSSFIIKMNAETHKTRIETSIKSLVDARNEFAHGGNPTSTVSDVIFYFGDCRRVIEIIDEILN